MQKSFENHYDRDVTYNAGSWQEVGSCTSVSLQNFYTNSTRIKKYHHYNIV